MSKTAIANSKLCIKKLRAAHIVKMWAARCVVLQESIDVGDGAVAGGYTLR